MYVVAGLGNPGRRYENTRHNLGFIAVDLLAQKHGIKLNKIKHKALIGEGVVAGRNVLLVKPQTYMNLSGESIREVIEYYKIDIENLLIIYDDIDIPEGQIRIRRKGSAGTHNGMRSIIYQIQDDQFPRVRIGIGGSRKKGLVHFVTSGFGKEEKEIMENAVTMAVLSVEAFLELGIDKAMTLYNIKPKQAREEEDSE